ncbi:hypothetical protein SAMN02745784_01369 [Tissierella praeacuta DSM 18095]|uniref:Uncharacterized protein n=1 Tax=Tissierella praeacuta DSM 18095 TaxID=1123404 RepID=A0A1M4V6E6_9FIRM|nr:hypothetical protein [Tissierella praeacuta]TCU74097.1 hypothetical protein EV204_104131 [Tissierella praeacuta]SHE64467.1 hypothetical protein SAMN02745784_01369 [Tissierella praeacuta DSM 18095]SUP02940.1 Uncharacterised protein [Tissierella praeacuta]
MKKSFIVFGVLLIMIFTSISIWGSNFIVKDEMKMEPNVKRVVTVGYSEKDKEEIFGDLSDEEINKILQEKVEELMKNGKLDLQNIENKDSIDLDKLIISVSDRNSNCDNLDLTK